MIWTVIIINNVALHAVHGAQGEGWAPGHMHVGRRGKNVFWTHHLMRFSLLSFENKQGGIFFRPKVFWKSQNLLYTKQVWSFFLCLNSSIQAVVSELTH